MKIRGLLVAMLVVPWGQLQGNEPKPVMTVASLGEDGIYTYVEKHRRESGYTNLVITRWRKAAPTKLTRQKLAIDLEGSNYDFPLRWHVSAGSFWVISVWEGDSLGWCPPIHLMRVPLTDLFGEQKGKLLRIGDRLVLSIAEKKYQYAGLHQVITRQNAKEGGFDPPGNRIPPFFYDFLASGKEHSLFFILRWSTNTMDVLKIKAPGIALGEPERISVPFGPFGEAFHCRVDQTGAYYFVTASGKVYVSPKAKDGQKRTVEALWVDPRRPIVAIIDNANTRKTTVFGRIADKGTKGFLFDLSPKPEVRYFDHSTLKPVNITGPTQTVVQYSQLLEEK